jgi:uncharacterized protein (TIGR02217 family)
MRFHEVRFPTTLSFGSLGGPERRTEIVRLANGFEERNSPWSHSLRRFDAGVGMRSLDDIGTLIAFFEARRGQLYAFRWKDWSDYKSCRAFETVGSADQVIGYGDGETRTFQLRKRYASGEQSYDRPIKKPVANTVTIAVSGVAMEPETQVTADGTTGIVTFQQPPADGAEIAAGFEFDVPVRFDTDRIMTSIEAFRAGEVPSVPIVEVRV